VGGGMSRIPAASRTVLLDDFRAGLRHFLIRVRSTAGDPLGVGVLVLAGLLTVPVWGIGPAPNPLLAMVLSPQSRTGLAIFFTGFVLVHLLWSVLVAATAAGRASGSSSGRIVAGRPMPTLPIGPRTRVFAEALAGVALVLATRAAILAVGGEPLARLATWGYRWSDLSQPAALAETTVAGVLLAFPMVLAWTAAAPLRGVGWRSPCSSPCSCWPACSSEPSLTSGRRRFCPSPSRSSSWPGWTLATRVPRASVKHPSGCTIGRRRVRCSSSVGMPGWVR